MAGKNLMEEQGMILVPGPRAGTPGLRMTFAAVTDLALQLHPCVEDLQRLFSLWDDEEVSHGTFTLTDLRKALPVVGVSAHPVDVQLLFDALDRHHHGHAAYGNLGARLAHAGSGRGAKAMRWPAGAHAASAQRAGLPHGDSLSASSQPSVFHTFTAPSQPAVSASAAAAMTTMRSRRTTRTRLPPSRASTTRCLPQPRSTSPGSSAWCALRTCATRGPCTSLARRRSLARCMTC